FRATAGFASIQRSHSPIIPDSDEALSLARHRGTGSGTSGTTAAGSAINWESLASESQTVLADYLRINTTNPPGNEILAARFLKAILDREGIEAQILDTTELGPNRANLYARLRGNGSRQAIALVHHMRV